MALTIAIEGTGIIANCDAISDTAGGTWFELGAGSIALSNDVYLIGGASIGGKYASKAGIQAIDKGATTYNFNSGGNQEGEHLYIWIAMTAIGTLDTKANYGLCIRLSSGSATTADTNYIDFLIAGNDDANGWTGSEWRCFVLDPTKTPTRSNGTVSSILAAVRSIGVWIDCSTSARADSIFIGGVAIGSGLRITGTSTTGWQDVVDYCTAYATRGWGMFQEREGIYYTYGKTYIGDATSQAANVSFEDKDRIIQFGTSEYWTGSAWVTAMDVDASGIVIEDHTSYTTTFTDGVIVGTEQGRSGCVYVGNSLLDVSLDLYGGNNTGSVTTLYGTSLKNLTGVLNSGNDVDHKFLSVSLSGCAQFNPVGACVVRNCIFAETADIDAALLWNESIDIEDSNFIANTLGAGIEMPSSVGTPYDYDNLQFSGNTNDVLNSSASAISISKSNTSNPTSSEGSAVTFTAGAVTVSVHVQKENADDIASAAVHLQAKPWATLDSTTTDMTDFTLNENGAAADTITRTTGSFITDGFDSADFITIKNSATAANDGTYTIVSVVALTITLSIGDLTASDSSNADLELNGTGPLPFEDIVTIVNSGTTATVTHTAHGMLNGDYVYIEGGSIVANEGVFALTYINANSYSYTMASTPGASPTGEIVASFVALWGLTDANGDISDTRVYGSNQPVSGWVRKSTGSPYYRPFTLSDTILSASGLALTAVMSLDE